MDTIKKIEKLCKMDLSEYIKYRLGIKNNETAYIIYEPLDNFRSKFIHIKNDGKIENINFNYTRNISTNVSIKEAAKIIITHLKYKNFA